MFMKKEYKTLSCNMKNVSDIVGQAFVNRRKVLIADVAQLLKTIDNEVGLLVVINN